MNTRRNFLRTAGIGLVAATTPANNISLLPAETGKNRKFDFKLGLASYSVRKFSREEALNMTL